MKLHSYDSVSPSKRSWADPLEYKFWPYTKQSSFNSIGTLARRGETGKDMHAR